MSSNFTSLNFELYTALQLIKEKSTGKNSRSSIGSILTIAVIGISISVAVMIISITIVSGFKKEIREKIIGFGGHIQISNFQYSEGIQTIPINHNPPFYADIDQLPEVKNIQIFANKAGILKTSKEIIGVIFKGIGSDFDWDFFNKHLITGHTFRVMTNNKTSNEVIISEKIANKMNLEVGDHFLIFFIKDNHPRPRKFTISGIYATDLEGFDELFVIGDIKHVQKLNDWDSTQVGGFEVNLNHYEDLDALDDFIFNSIPFEYQTSTITSKNPNLFGWLALQDVNVMIIIGLLILVSGINMASALLIMILDRTRMIGIYQTMGATNGQIRNIFLYLATYLTGVGLFWGNLIGLGLACIQKYFKVFTLPPETYYITHIPINIELSSVILLNIFTLILCVIMLIAPTYIITRIETVEAIKLD